MVTAKTNILEMRIFVSKINILNRQRSIWVKVFKNRPSKICGTQPLKNFKGCLPQILLGPFLNILTHLIVEHGVWLILRKFHH